MKSQYRFQSPIGPLYLIASPDALCGIYFKKQDLPLQRDLKAKTPETKIFKQAVNELTDYFEGKRKSFHVPTASHGTAFQKKVWNELKRIPYGKTLSYRDLAERVGHPKAYRAVGTANGQNPYCIFVPCHRVIGADGSIGGYAGGTKIKAKLLALESQKGK